MSMLKKDSYVETNDGKNIQSDSKPWKWCNHEEIKECISIVTDNEDRQVWMQLCKG